MADIFISYAREDRPEARRLAAELSQRGWSVWWDEEIRSGATFDELIEAKIREARCVVVLWSRHSVRSPWVRAEASVGLRRAILISVRIEPEIELPIQFTNVHTIDLIGEESFDDSPEFDRILKDIEATVGQRSLPEPQAPVRLEGSERPREVLRDQQSVRQRRLLSLAALLGGLLAVGVASWFVWTSLRIKTHSPSLGNWPVRAEHAAIAHADKIWILGGERSGVPEPLNDVWSSPDGRDWEQVDASALWPKRCGHTAASYRGSLWILGGQGEQREPLNDVWYGNGSEWRRAVARARWTPRSHHAVVVFKDRIWILGGYNTVDGPLRDVWSSQDGRAWTLATSAAPWPPRRSHAAVVHQDKIWILGGENHGTLLNDVWSSSDGVHWIKATGAAAWDPRSWHTAASFDKRLWLLGGGSTEGGLDGSNDVWSSEDGARWTRVTEFAAWHARQAHASVVFQRRLWVMGGFTGGYQGPRLNDIWSSLDGETWR